MPSRFDLVLQRVERAKEQRRDLEREMRAWAEGGAYRVASRFDLETGYTRFYLDQALEVTPKIAALIAELLHSLRTALDNLAYQLFLVSRTDPADEGGGVYFPIYDDSKMTEVDAFRKIRTFRKEIVEAIRTVNTSKGGNPLLWVLHRLDIVDKHRRVLTSTLVHHSVFLRDAQRQLLLDAGFADMLPFVALRPAFVKSARTGLTAKVGDVVLVGMPGDEKVNEKLKFTFDVAFDEPGIIEGKSIIETLDEMLKLVEGIILTFQPFLV